MTLAELITMHDGLATSTAILTRSGRLTYADLRARAEHWRRTVASATPASAPVGVLMDEPGEFVSAALGAWQAGCPVLPLDPALHPSQAHDALNESGAGLLVTDRDASSLPPLEGLRVTVLTSPDGGSPASGAAPASGDPALLLYSSGTTGTPKCVVFSHGAMVRNVRALIDVTGLTAEDCVMTPLAPALAAALATCVLPALAIGARLVLPGRVLPMQTARLLAEHGVSVFHGVPFVYDLLSRLEVPQNPSQLRLCITNSAPMAHSVAEGFERRFGHLPRSNYCSSEAGAITFNGSDDRDLVLGSVGTALPGVRVRVVDDEGRDLEAGAEGRIVVHSPMVATGYLDRPDLTAEVFRDGAVWTDDLGRLDAGGNLWVTGRISAMVNIAGHLVNPATVEAVLVQHDNVAEALVRGEDDDETGQRLSALVVPRGDLDLGALRSYCFERLPGHAVPHRFVAVPSLARTSLGKPQRRQAGG